MVTDAHEALTHEGALRSGEANVASQGIIIEERELGEVLDEPRYALQLGERPDAIQLMRAVRV